MSLELSGTTGVKGVAGSVSAPSIVADDTNTGISFPAADTIKFSTGGVERIVINNSGISGTGISSGGLIKQFVYAEMSSDFGMNSTNETDVGGMTASISLTDASNDVLVELTFNMYVGGAGAAYYQLKVYRDSTVLYQNNNAFYRTADDLKSILSSIRFLDTGISDTSSHTYKLTAARTGGDDGLGIYVSPSGTYAVRNSITLTEIS